MVALDRVAWTGGLAFVSYGVRFGVRVNDPVLLDRLPEYLPQASKSTTLPVDLLYSLQARADGEKSGRERYLLHAGPHVVSETDSLDRSLDGLRSWLDFYVAVGARSHLFVHAGAVGWRGRAILIPGRSRSGKTTLVAALVRAGATYYSDEFAVVDGRGRVHPFAKPLSLRDPEGGGARSVTAEELGAVSGTRPLPVGVVLLSSYRPQARWRPTRLTPGAALLSLVPHTVPVRRRPQASLRALTAMVERAVVVKSVRGEAQALAPLLLKQLDEVVATARGRGRVS
jgi:hypothetical protein